MLIKLDKYFKNKKKKEQLFVALISALIEMNWLLKYTDKIKQKGFKNKTKSLKRLK